MLETGCSQSEGFIQESGGETFSSPSEPKSPFDILHAFSIVWAQQVRGCLRRAQQIGTGFVTKTWKEWSRRGGQGNWISLTSPLGFKVPSPGRLDSDALAAEEKLRHLLNYLLKESLAQV